MMAVMVLWVLSMISALSWARSWTAVLTGMTAMLFAGTQGARLGHWTGWMQAAVLILTPWLLALQRQRDELRLKELHAREAHRMTTLSEAARALLALRSSTQEMERQITEITDVYHVTKETVRALRLSELFQASLDIAPRLLNARGLRLIDLSSEQPRILRASRATDGEMLLPSQNGGPPGESPPQMLEMEEAIVKQTLASARSASGGAQELSCPLPEGISRVAWAPLWREQKPIGVLVADELPEQQLKMLSMVANQLSLQLSRIHLYGQVEALAVTDALTGLFVRGYFLERAREELERSKRHHLCCTLMMADLDFFKQKNDTFGHLVGDVVLKDVARLLQRNLRGIDLIARFGGEEFILLLVETAVEQGLTIAQRLRQLVEVHPIRAYDELITQTVSIGVAGFPEDAQTLEALIEQADQALYAAKRAGRNRVIRWTPQLTSASSA